MPLRQPAVAGRFYPGGREKLTEAVSSFLDAADNEPDPDRVSTVVAPHAGYPFSGPTAGYAFRRVQGMAPLRVVILGPSHHYRFNGFSIYDRGAWETPLGTVPIDEDVAAAMVRTFDNTMPEAHVPEHALEVELPFLQAALEPGFTIVPVLTGSASGPIHQAFAEWLAKHLEPGDLIVASTDLSHFLDEETANAIDRATLDMVLSGDPGGIAEGMNTGKCSLCGATAVYTALAAANQTGATNRTLWDYRTSGRASGEYSRVVGYGAVTLERTTH